MEEKEIKGEIEAWSGVRDKGTFGSRGVKVDGDWHNAVGSPEELEKLDKENPKGSFVSFKVKMNKKGYWNISGEIINDELHKKEDLKEEPITQAEAITERLNGNYVKVKTIIATDPKDFDKEINDWNSKHKVIATKFAVTGTNLFALLFYE